MTKKANPVSRSGRFSRDPNEQVARFSESVSFDRRLWKQDIVGSIAHARMLRKIGVLTRKELEEITGALEEIGHEIENGGFEWKVELEDVHMNIESALTQKTPAGAKLHTGRSRNDQVALDLRMWLRDEILEVLWELKDLQKALVQLAADHAETALPGYTHLQRAQPVCLAHHLLAYVEMFDRDRDRFQDGFRRANVCPLGNGALAGSTLPLDRNEVARFLGFVDGDNKPRLTQNSMDGVSDRDVVVEFCSNAALTAVHLSRLAEDLILWSSEEFKFIEIDDAYTTGSSLMPQKKNPDLAELTRGKTGRTIGNLVAALTLLKGLPMTYNRDLQEDKEPLFDSADTIRACLRVNAAMLRHTRVNAGSCRAAASDPALLATDLADYLVRKGMPFREAHHAVGKIVALSERKKKPLNRLTLKEMRQVSPLFDADAADVFDLDSAMAKRTMTGAPSKKEIQKQLTRWKRTLKD